MDVFTIIYMRTSRAAGLVLLATAATLAQQPQSVVEITSEPSHHLVLENEYVRVFNVVVSPKATTLIHRHNHDYLFVTLGDSDLINARVNEKPVHLQLKDGDVRYTPGHFAHAAVNESVRPFHNTTIELLKPSSNVQQCTEKCAVEPEIASGPRMERRITAAEWNVWSFTMPSSVPLYKSAGSSSPALFVAVSALDLSVQGDASAKTTRRTAGDIVWIPPDTAYTVRHNGPQAQFVLLYFNPEKPQP